MSFQINTNIGALNAYNALAKVNADTYKAQIRLATQKRINSVADDTSGFAVGKALDQKVKLMESAQRNVGSAKDMLSTGETQLSSMKDLITQIKSKIADASNAAANKGNIAADIKALGSEIENIFATTKFNDTHLLASSANGVPTSGFSFQTGAESSDTLAVDFSKSLAGSTKLTASGAGSTVSVNAAVSLAIATLEGANTTDTDTMGVLNSTFATNINSFESMINTALSSVGNLKQRLDVKDDFLTAAISNSKASVSRLFDADMAMEQLNATKGTIGAQAATAMLSQLNSAPQNILQLFR